MILEAMKMQMPLLAPMTGKVSVAFAALLLFDMCRSRK